MANSILKAAALALTALPLINAQTFTSCDPTKRPDCPIDPGLTESEYSVDFRQGAEAAKDWTATTGSITYTPEGAQFQINQLGDGPTIATNFYIFFGYVEVTMKAAPGRGIVSSFVLQSDDLDEFDWEWIGSDGNRAQTNYFGKGNTTTYDRGQFHDVSTTTETFHTYAINWTADSATWLIDGAPIRTLNFAEAVGGTNYPQTPVNIRLGNWVAGDPKNQPGTIQWAGGLADMSQAPFNMVVQSVRITNYKPAPGYKYGDMSGTWQSIELVQDAKANSVRSLPGTGTATATGSYGAGSENGASAVGGQFAETTGAASPAAGGYDEDDYEEDCSTSTVSMFLGSRPTAVLTPVGGSAGVAAAGSNSSQPTFTLNVVGAGSTTLSTADVGAAATTFPLGSTSGNGTATTPVKFDGGAAGGLRAGIWSLVGIVVGAVMLSAW